MFNKKFFIWLRNRSLLFKIFLTYTISLSIIGLIGYSYYIYNNIKSIDREVAIYKKKLTNEKKIFVKNIVNIAIKGIERYYLDFKDSLINEEIAKKSSIEFIDSIRYIDKLGSSYGYIWVNTLDGIMIVDPPKPELNGKNVWDLKDSNGVYLFREMANVVKMKGEGYVHYCWQKLGKNNKKCYPKISFVKYFPQWGWIVGSGFYLDDIDKAILDYKDRIKNDIKYTIFNSLIFGCVATFIAGFIFFLIVFYITSHLKKISELSIKLTEEEVTPDLKLPYSSKDEIGQLISNFNYFIDENYKLMVFKKIIENDENLEVLYTRIENLLIDEFKIKKFNILEVNNSKNSIKLIKSFGDFCCKQEILIDSASCRAVRTANIVNCMEAKNICTNFTCAEKLNYICIPLIISGNVGNVIQILSDENIFSQNQINRLNKFLNEAAPVIESKRLLAQLRESTLKDPLTGLYNRRFLDESVELLEATVLRRNSKLAILMCDIDFFKKVNDIYGHNVGDLVLQEIAKILKKSVRASDLVVRFGGEEFLIILQDVNEENSVKLAEKIRQNVEKLQINVSGNILKKTISIGLSIFPLDGESLWQCIKFSDVALYKAKESGRNRVVRFESSMWNEEDF